MASDICFRSRVTASLGQFSCDLCYWAFGICCSSVILGVQFQSLMKGITFSPGAHATGKACWCPGPISWDAQGGMVQNWEDWCLAQPGHLGPHGPRFLCLYNSVVGVGDPFSPPRTEVLSLWDVLVWTKVCLWILSWKSFLCKKLLLNSAVQPLGWDLVSECCILFFFFSSSLLFSFSFIYTYFFSCFPHFPFLLSLNYCQGPLKRILKGY